MKTTLTYLISSLILAVLYGWVGYAMWTAAR